MAMAMKGRKVTMLGNSVVAQAMNGDNKSGKYVRKEVSSGSCLARLDGREGPGQPIPFLHDKLYMFGRSLPLILLQKHWGIFDPYCVLPFDNGAVP